MDESGYPPNLLEIRRKVEARAKELLAQYQSPSPAPAAQATVEQEPPRSKIYASRCVNLGEFLEMNLPPREIMLAPWLTAQSLNMIHAYRGLGKSWLALSIAYAAASGGEVCGWKAQGAWRVLYVDGELAASTLQQRLALIAGGSATEADPDSVKILTPDLQPNGIMPNLSDEAGQAVIDADADDVNLIVIDNLSCLSRGGKENEGESWLPLQFWALRHRAAGRSVLFIHHSGKGGQQRGTSRREDVLDTVIGLRRPPDYETRTGAAFELHFEKSRNMTGAETDPIEAQLTDAPGDGVTWSWQLADGQIIERAKVLLADGATRKELCEELGLSRFALKRLADRWNLNHPDDKVLMPDARKHR